MYHVTGIIPARFLTIIAHLITTITILWSRDANVKACLPLQYSSDEYVLKDTQLTIGLSLTIVLISFELISFFAGISMFAPMTSLLSILSHTAACICLFYFVFDVWDCDLFWWIFGFCSVAPLLAEALAIIQTLCVRRGV